MLHRLATPAARLVRMSPAVFMVVGLILGAALTVPSSVSASGYTDPGNNAASTNESDYVLAGYQSLLGRTPDAAGHEFHSEQLRQGGHDVRRSFAYSMLFSVEGSRQEVERAYTGLLGRAADNAGADYWTRHLQGHDIVDLRVLLMSSDEYWNGSGRSEADWLEALYRDTLGRVPDDAGRTYWLEQIDRGVVRPLVAAGLYQSDEALGRRADAHYSETLGRLPDVDERIDAINTIRARGERELRAELWATTELFEQYGPTS